MVASGGQPMRADIRFLARLGFCAMGAEVPESTIGETSKRLVLLQLGHCGQARAHEINMTS